MTRPNPRTSVVDTVQLDAELVGDEAAVASPEVAEYALGLGDDALILAQQLGWWISRAPELEEDIALANIALDLLGHARSLLRYAGTADGRTEDDLAYWRDEREFRSRWLFEQPNGDFAHTIVRQLLASTYFRALYAGLAASADPTLAAIAAKAEKEVAYHLDHAEQWMRRLALGTDESRRRTIVALTDLWPYLGELFVDDEAALVAARGSRCSRRPCATDVGRRARRHPERLRARGPRRAVLLRAAAARAGTPATSASCSPRCRCWPGSIRGRHGDRDPHPRVGHRRRGGRPGDPGADDRGPRRAPLRRGGRRPRARASSRRPTADAPPSTR